MELSDAIKKRRSIRKFLDKKIPADVLLKIIDAGRLAPSAKNQQPLELIIVKDKKLRKSIRQIYDEARKIGSFYAQETSFMENGTPIIILADKNKSWHIFSVAMACENMLLAATDLGIGSVTIGAIYRNTKGMEEIKKTFKIPDNMEIAVFLVFGYPDEKPEPRPRRELKEIVNYDKYNNRIL